MKPYKARKITIITYVLVAKYPGWPKKVKNIKKSY